MPQYLVDSHIYLWMLHSPEQIGPKTTNILSDGGVVLGLSIASLWELSVKYRKGKLSYSPAKLYEGLSPMGIDLVPISPESVMAIDDLKDVAHKDPFDLILILQAKKQDMLLVTADIKIIEQNLPFVVDARE